MLIRALAEHAGHRTDLPAPYYRRRSVRWALDLTPDGRPRGNRLIDLSTAEAKAGQLMATPYVQRSGVAPPPFLLTDTLQYVLAMPKDDSDKQAAEAERRAEHFAELIARWAADEPLATPVLRFLQSGAHLRVGIPEDAKPTDVVAIRTDHGWVHDLPSAVTAWGYIVRERKSSDGGEGICLVCGQPGSLLDTIPEPVKPGAIPVADGRGRDAQLVSINKSAQGRGGTTQLANTPICDLCGGSAMSALNALLADPHHHSRGTDSVLAWWLRRPAPISPLGAVRKAVPQEVNAIIEQVRLAPDRRAPWLDSNFFYAVTLSANQSRVVVRDYIDVPLIELCESVDAWFTDHAMTDPRLDGPQRVPLWRMVAALGRFGDPEYVKGSSPPSAERDLLAAALRNKRLPAYLLPRLIQRIRADGRTDLPRAALLRLLLVRADPAMKEILLESLNLDATDPAYLSGRIFAVMENIQRTALDNINTTIGDKFFAAAMGRPLAVLTMLRKNSVGHLRRLRGSKRAAGIALDRRLDELFSRFTTDLPAVLDLPGQGRFMLGYHQQRAHDREAARATARGNDTPPEPA
ncbi:type I-C CRISPR-associated protein Cas8c/Csd1 [Sinosporangium siamense]|uniref:Type I-C CRISPR-associated protein Cas8c/Csd1 n=1 Tax=Sinosporangium siamense TaxID=1367973 RepID=A0A919RPN8_9ACTN|nr:type I-C CRISPR-associated protein Cas8c/Csd1 [Sinosporangium siamense]GII96710.1 type I-C CRISPR-associated protein Cas8c/Csd1 [Sinosporangium siamense]